MKKLAMYLGIIVLLFGVLYAVDYVSEQQVNKKLSDAAMRLYKTTPDKLSKSTRDQLNDENYQRIILPDELAEKLANKESLVVYMFSPECPYCRQTTPILNEIAEEVGADYRQLNVFEFLEMWDTYNINATPTLIYFENGEEVARIEGGIGGTNTRETFRQFLQTYATKG
jgi:thiol-disulfide isomerase/thioredoxin